MATEAPIDVLRRATRAWNEQDWSTWETCYSDPSTFHLDSGTRELSHADHRKAGQSWFRAFPDMTATIESLFGERDRAFVRWSYEGTHLGRTASGVEPSGQRIDIGMLLAECRFEDGRSVEVWESGRFVSKEELERRTLESSATETRSPDDVLVRRRS